jgi:hypothetical protein
MYAMSLFMMREQCVIKILDNAVKKHSGLNIIIRTGFQKYVFSDYDLTNIFSVCPPLGEVPHWRDRGPPALFTLWLKKS